MLHAFYQETQNIVKNITWSGLNHSSLSKRSTGCTTQDLGREHSILLSVTNMFCINQVCHGVSRCVKGGSCSSSSLEWKSVDSIKLNEISYYLSKCYRLSNISQITTFSFRKTVHRCVVCVTQCNWVKMWFSHFPVLPFSAEAQVTWGGILKHLLIAYFIDNISAKKISKSIYVCQSYSNSKPKWDFFWDTGVGIWHAISTWHYIDQVRRSRS